MKYPINSLTEEIKYNFVVFNNLLCDDKISMVVYSKTKDKLEGIEVQKVQDYIDWKSEEE